MAFAILDANVYIDHWERSAHAEELSALRLAFIIRHSAVVLSELRRGARSVAARKTIEGLLRVAAVVWVPTADDWWRAGEIVAKLGNRLGWGTAKRRDFQNDALIGLTARRHGAVVVTSNRSDFELLAKELSIKLWLLGRA